MGGLKIGPARRHRIQPAESFCDLLVPLEGPVEAFIKVEADLTSNSCGWNLEL